MTGDEGTPAAPPTPNEEPTVDEVLEDHENALQNLEKRVLDLEAGAKRFVEDILPHLGTTTAVSTPVEPTGPVTPAAPPSEAASLLDSLVADVTAARFGIGKSDLVARLNSIREKL